MESHLDRVIELAKAGQRAPARDLLLALLREDPRNVAAWKWFASVSETEEEARRAVETILRLEPGDAWAQRVIDTLDAQREREGPPGVSTAIRFENLGKTFGGGAKRVEAVKNLNLTVATGQVYGFLGPNGAGKTTTIGMIMSLIRPTQGSVYVYGQDVQRHHDALKRVGALVEDATFYNFLSGRKNLEVIARTEGTYDAGRIDHLLEQVGLSDRADHRVKGFSTGMKQRLGLAAALLSDPDLVILDEPTNGLDPGGIQEMRHFIRALAHEHGKTVFLSSHLLAEVEQVCDRVAIINEGQIVREGSVVELLTGQSELRVEVDRPDEAAQALAGAWKVSIDSGQLAVEGSREDAPRLTRWLVEAGIDVYQLSIRRQTLEEYFLDVTAQGDGGDDD